MIGSNDRLRDGVALSIDFFSDVIEIQSVFEAKLAIFLAAGSVSKNLDLGFSLS